MAARQRRFNPRQFLKAAVIFACGAFLLVQSGALVRPRRHRWKFPEETRQAVESWLGWGLIPAAVWFYEARSDDDDDDEPKNVTPN